MKLIADNQSAEPVQPGEQPLHNPAAQVTAQRSAVLGLAWFSRLGAIISIPYSSSRCRSSGSESYAEEANRL